MADGELVLRLGLEGGRHANAAATAQSLLAWVSLVRESARAIDPFDDVVVELTTPEPGSIQFPQILRYADNVIRDISDGADDYPHLKAVAIGLALASASAVIQVGIEKSIEPDVETVRIDDAQMAKLLEDRDKVAASPAVQSAARHFFQTVEKDPAVTEVTVAETTDGPALAVIPRSDFPARGGLWTPEEAPAAEHTIRDTWDVVLLRAPFVHVPRSWTFSRHGLAFSAKMEDPAFLAAVGNGTIPIRLQEGVTMRVEVEFRERLTGQVWTYIEGTRKVVKVLSPQPLAAPFPMANAPKKD